MTELKQGSRTADRELVTAMVGGDERALAELYDRYGGAAYALAHAVLGDAADAEETVSDAFVQAWAQASSFDPGRAGVAGWLLMIVRSRALDRLRARRRRTRTLELAASEHEEGIAIPLAAAEPAPDRGAELRELRTVVADALATLPESQRRVVELAYFGGLTQSEIADALDEPLGTVKTRTRAAMEKLRGALVPYFER